MPRSSDPKLKIETAREIRALRPPKPAHDPWRPLGVQREFERLPGSGETVPALTIFLTGAECPFTCVFCDLWQYTLPERTPRGALPKQIEIALAHQAAEPRPAGPHGPNGSTVKLYNASNFFEPRAVPLEDLAVIARQLRGFSRVVVECHPRLIGDGCFEFAGQLNGKLEVAMGLETVHPEALPRLNKGMTLDDWSQAAKTLTDTGIGVRAFVLLGAPFVPADEIVDWSVRSVEWAVDRGARHASIIPLRAGNGAVDSLVERGQATVPRLPQLEEALERSIACAGSRAVVTADLWDLDRFALCDACLDDRRARLERINQTGRLESPIGCSRRDCPEGRGKRS